MRLPPLLSWCGVLLLTGACAAVASLVWPSEVRMHRRALEVAGGLALLGACVAGGLLFAAALAVCFPASVALGRMRAGRTA